MFNINRLGLNKPRTGKSSKKKKGDAVHSSSTEHSSSLKENTLTAALSQEKEEMLNKDLHAFIVKIDKQGERLRDHPNKKEFLKYKALISRFMKKIIRESMKIKKQKVYKKEREYIITQLIDEKLFELGHYLMLEEADHLIIAEKIDIIKGMIFDSFSHNSEAT